jgi:UDP-4-amino-4,6-dideoxy-N-acetyl-beta-L-altrosamine transaminase
VKPFSYGRQSIDQDDVDAVVSALTSDWLTQGPAVEAFENSVAEYVGVKHAVAYSSGTSALHGAAAAAGITLGDSVVTSPLTFMASANAARFVGATPQLIDIDRETWNLDLALLENSPRAVIPVHYAGLPVRLENSNLTNSIVIEDAAHALGSLTPDGPVGNCAHSAMCCFSFHPVKPITTAEGGMVTTNDDELADRLRRFRSHGIVRYTNREPWYYEVKELGYNYRMADIQAALGSSQMKKVERFISRRNEIAERYRTLLNDVDIELPPAAPAGYRHGYHLFPILVENRRAVFESLRDEGIGVQVHYVPVHYHPVSQDMGYSKGDFPVAEAVYEKLISLPIFPEMTDAQQDFVVIKLRELCG